MMTTTMTNKTTAALKLAEEALEELHYSSGTVKAVTLYKSALAAIREALAEPVKQEPLDDDARDNMLLWMIQRHFPSLPLSDEHTDWGRWLGFANAVFEAGRKDAAPVRTKDLTDDDLEKTYDEICRNASSSERLLFRYGRAVIAADREKNK